MSYLSETNIIDLVKGYIAEDIYNYAIMINGAWGSGKTYFIKEILVSELEKSNIRRKAVYVSLYGQKSVDEIANCLLTSIIELRMGKAKKMLPFLRAGVNILTDVLGGKLDSKTVEDADDNILSPFISYDDYYFIFDDLERCSMPINEALAYINNFVEQNNAKVLLVAHEDEIGSVDLLENKLMRHLIATQDNVLWPEKEESNFFGNYARKPSSTSKATLEDIKYRMELLSEENTFYLRVKEKLVGQTVYYQPDLKKIVPIIFSKCLKIEDLNSEQLFIEKICAILEMENYYNLRTLQFSLSFAAKINHIFSKLTNRPQIYSDVMLQILEAVLKVSIYYKRQGKIYEWADNSEYGMINLHEKFNFSNHFKSFKFIHKYVYYGDCDFTYIQDVLTTYIEGQTLQQDELTDPVNMLSFYWELEDNVIEAHLTKLYCNLQSGKYEGNSYRYILSLLFKLKGLGFEPISLDKHIAIMKENISRGATIETRQEPCITTDDPFIDDYRSALAQLKEIESLSSEKVKSNSINSTFKPKSGWGAEFADYCSKNRDAFMLNRAFFKHVDVDACYSAIENGNAKDISDFRRAVYSIYDFSNLKDFYIEDADNMNRLVERLSKRAATSKMEKFNIDILSENLRSFLERLK